MSCLNRVGMAASVAVAQGHTEIGHKWKSGLKSLRQGRRLLSSGENPADLRPLSSLMGSEGPGAVQNCDAGDRRAQTEDSLRRVMYLNCWGQGWFDQKVIVGDVWRNLIADRWSGSDSRGYKGELEFKVIDPETTPWGWWIDR